MPGHYLDFEAPLPRVYPGAQARNDAYRHDDEPRYWEAYVETFQHPANGTWGYTLFDFDWRQLRAGCGWPTEAAATDAAREWIRT